jgi:hypothetical protein
MLPFLCEIRDFPPLMPGFLKLNWQMGDISATKVAKLDQRSIPKWCIFNESAAFTNKWHEKIERSFSRWCQSIHTKKHSNGHYRRTSNLSISSFLHLILWNNVDSIKRQHLNDNKISQLKLAKHVMRLSIPMQCSIGAIRVLLTWNLHQVLYSQLTNSQINSRGLIRTQFLSNTILNDASNQLFKRIVLKTGRISKKLALSQKKLSFLWMFLQNRSFNNRTLRNIA